MSLSLPFDAPSVPDHPRSEYTVGRSFVERRVTDRAGFSHVSRVALADSLRKRASGASDAESLFDAAWLRSRTKPAIDSARGSVRTVDLFAGCGGLSLGLEEAARALSMELRPLLANDVDADALRTYSGNWSGARLESVPVEELIDGDLGQPPTLRERRLQAELGRVDVLIGGPPCQGHSDLNNHTRRADPKNALYLRMARFCELMLPDHVIIENVPGVLHDRSQVAQRTWEALENLGYAVSTGIMNAADLGVAQRRKRSITLASRKIVPDIRVMLDGSKVPERPLWWAISDLADMQGSAPFDVPPTPKPEGARRIDYLFDRGLYDLPDTERPDCHRLKRHSYVSMYGRMHADKPAQTLTTGFGTMGRGRFVHPTRRRTITPHEAARIQFFPDFFKWAPASRTKLQTQIGNAVPAKLGYVLGVHLLG